MVLDSAGTVLAEVLLLKQEDGSYYVKGPDGEDVWSLSRFTAEDFLKPAKEFRSSSGS